jgi:hypothetical protein
MAEAILPGRLKAVEMVVCSVKFECGVDISVVGDGFVRCIVIVIPLILAT